MTVTLEEPVVGTTLTYKGTLDLHRDAMVRHLVESSHVPQATAELMIDQLWERLVQRLVVDYAHEGVDLPLAERIMNEAFGFLFLCAAKSGYGPSRLVDLGWHTFILYTMEYAAFGAVIADRYLHHAPTDVEGLHMSNPAAETSKCTGGKCTGGGCTDQVGKCRAPSSGVCPGNPAVSAKKCSNGCSGDIGCTGARVTARTSDAGHRRAALGRVIRRPTTATSTTTPARIHVTASVVDHPRVAAAYPDGTCTDRPGQAPRTIADTVAAMMALGPVDEMLWVNHSVKCMPGCVPLKCKSQQSDAILANAAVSPECDGCCSQRCRTR